MARYVAKNIVAAGIANKYEIQIAYAIGVAQSVSIAVDAFNTGKYSNEEIVDAITELFDLRPDSIIKRLEQRNPIYQKLAAYRQG